jgi:hypothetical protein
MKVVTTLPKRPLCGNPGFTIWVLQIPDNPKLNKVQQVSLAVAGYTGSPTVYTLTEWSAEPVANWSTPVCAPLETSLPSCLLAAPASKLLLLQAIELTWAAWRQ